MIKIKVIFLGVVIFIILMYIIIKIINWYNGEGLVNILWDWWVKCLDKVC